MKHEQIDKINQEISELLSTRHFTQALFRLREECRNLDLTDLCERAENLMRDYGYMIDYYEQGASDPAREEMFDHLYNDSWILLDQWCDQAETLSSTFYYYSQKRLLKQRGLRLPEMVEDFINLCSRNVAMLDSKEKTRHWEEIDALGETVWLAVWTDFPSTKKNRSAIQRLLLDENVPLPYRASFLSAMTLGLLNYFDAEKTEDLFTYTLDGMPRDMTQRAWIGYFLVCLKHNYRIDHLPRLQSQIQYIVEQHKAHRPGEDNLLLLQILLLQACGTQDVEQKLRTQIMPDIQKGLQTLTNKILNDQKKENPIRIIEIDEEGEMVNLNPEWKKEFEKTNLSSRFHDFAQLEANGEDVRYSTFRTLSKLSFYRTYSHWFLPLDPDLAWNRVIVERNPSLWKMQKAMQVTQRFCNTEAQGSLLYMWEMISHNGSDDKEPFPSPKMVARLESLMPEEHKEQSEDEIALAYVQDLYRFLTLAPHSEEWENPFTQRDMISFSSSSWLAPLISRKSEAQDIAQYLFSRERWKEAVLAIQRWLDFEITEEGLQKLAYACYQKEVDDEVLTREALTVCNSLYPDKQWTLNYLISFYLKEEEYNAAELTLRHALELWPDDKKLLLKQAECFVAQRRWKDAFEPLFKIDLMQEGLSKVNRLLARCNLMTKHYEKAEKYISDVLRKKPTRKDWQLGGYISFLGGNVPQGIERFTKSLASKKWTFDEFQESVFNEWPDLVEAGVRDSDLSLALESLRRKGF